MKTKNSRNQTIRILSIVPLMLAISIISITIIGVYAAEKLNLNGLGGINYKPEYVPPTEEEIIDNETTLNNGGFQLTNGTILSNTNPGSVSAEKHYALTGKNADGTLNGLPSVLSYIRYKNSVCEQENNVIAVLDLSRTNITGFDDKWFTSMPMVIFGSGGIGPFTEPITIYDAVTGESEESTITVPTDVQVSGKLDYSLRIILPNYAIENGMEIEFQAKSLTFSTDNGPKGVELDVSFLDLKINPDNPLDILGLNISSSVSGNRGLHFHFIASLKRMSQLEFAFLNATNFIFTESKGDSVVELFIKEDRIDSHFSKLDTKIERIGTNNKVVIYGLPSSDYTEINKDAIVGVCKFMNMIDPTYFSKVSLTYIRRNENNTPIGTEETITVYQNATGSYQAGDIFCGDIYVGNYLTWSLNL